MFNIYVLSVISKESSGCRKKQNSIRDPQQQIMLILERLRVAFAANSKREFLPRHQVFHSLVFDNSLFEQKYK